MKIELPSLADYRTGFINEGVTIPLPTVPFISGGLLSELPSLNSDRTGWPWTEETNPEVYSNKLYWPKLTIVTPSYNQGPFLEETIRSVLLQNYPNLEYIIIDGGSTDNTRDVIEKYAQWISYWQSKKDNGQGQAINMGFSIASGIHHAWINSDDYYLKNVFHTVVTSFLKSKADFIYGFGLNYHLKDGKFELVKMLPHKDYFIKIPTLIQPSTFWTASIHKPIWEELHCSLDFELWLRLIRGNKKHLLREPLSVANVHEDAKTFDPKMKEKWQEDHIKIWSEEAHGRVHEWKKIVFLHRVRVKLYKLLNYI